MKRTSFAGAFCALLLLVGCVSSDRMLSYSPLGGEVNKSVPTAKLSFDSHDVNLWPLVYANKDFTSVLWPIYDMDANGMAVRPFFNQHLDEYSILFPLAAWNPVNGDGWVIPVHWDIEKESWGCFPLYEHTAREDSFVTFYIKRDKEKNLCGGGIMPISYFSKDSGYFFPFVYNSGFEEWGVFPVVWYFPQTKVIAPAFLSQDNEKNLVSGGIIPISYFNKDWGYFANFWYNKNFEEWGVFPVAWSFPQAKVFAPVCLTYDSDGKLNGGGCSPIAYGNRDWGYFANFWYNKSFEEWGLFPILWRFPKTSVVAPAYWTYDEEDHCDGGGILPLFGYFRDQKNDATTFNCLGVGGHYNRKGDNRSFGSLPLLTLYSDKEDNGHTLFAAGYISCRDNQDRTDGFFPIAVRKESETEVKWDCLFPMFSLQYQKADHTVESFHSWPLFGYHSRFLHVVNVNEDSLTAFTPFVFMQSWTDQSSRIEEEQTRLTTAGDFDNIDNNFRYCDRTAGIWGYDKSADLSVVHSKPIEEDIDKAEENFPVRYRIKTHLDDLDETLVEEVGKTTWSDLGIPFFPMLYRKQSLGDEYRWHGPGSFWLAFANGYKIGDCEEIKIMQFLYRYRRQGDMERTIFFPGCSFVKEGDNTRFNFWYRVWEYQVKDGDVSGHFFFIPF